MKDSMVTIPRVEYNLLVNSYKTLVKLQEYGVDNWEGYGEAMRS